MAYFERHIAFAEQIFHSYPGGEPFHLYLKKYFSANKKFGSRDRRQIRDILYAVFRLGPQPAYISFKEKVILSYFLQGKLSDLDIKEYDEYLLKIYEKDFATKCRFLEQKGIQIVFPYSSLLSREIDPEAYGQSFFREPSVFIRLKKNVERGRDILKQTGIELEDHIFKLPPGFAVDRVLRPDEYIVQDFHSYKTLSLLDKVDTHITNAWDVCAGSGGKSIALLEKFPDINLYASDVRRGILDNLKERFHLYGLKAKKVFTMTGVLKVQESMELVLCDVPCTGSGTWPRTPESAYYFQQDRIREFNIRQIGILNRVAENVIPGGYLLYVTCSVFADENENIIQMFLKENKSFEKIAQHYFLGYQQAADTLFAALLRKTDMDAIGMK